VKRLLPIAIAGLAAASALSWTAAAAAPPEPRIVYRTVRLSAPARPPELYSILPSGQGRRLLVRGGEQAAWSPGRKRIAFSRGVVGKAGIWVMNADGRAARRLTTSPGDGEPTWSPDGRRIVFRRSSATNFDLWVVPSSGGRAVPLLRTPIANELDPDWSPDGRRLAFQSSRGGQIQIWVMNLASKHARRLTRGAASFSPDWAQDGRRIAFATGGRIGIVDADSRRRRLLPTGTPRSADDPAWSPDGRRISFQRGGQVLTMRADGGGLRYLTRAAWGTNGEPDW
jgi:Tol biopolymer transport system component